MIEENTNGETAAAEEENMNEENASEQYGVDADADADADAMSNERKINEKWIVVDEEKINEAKSNEEDDFAVKKTISNDTELTLVNPSFFEVRLE